MAKLKVFDDKDIEIASVDLPDTFTDFVGKIVGGKDTKETSQNFLNESVEVLRTHFYKKRIIQIQKVPQEQIQQAEIDASVELATEWSSE